MCSNIYQILEFETISGKSPLSLRYFTFNFPRSCLWTIADMDIDTVFSRTNIKKLNQFRTRRFLEAPIDHNSKHVIEYIFHRIYRIEK